MRSEMPGTRFVTSERSAARDEEEEEEEEEEEDISERARRLVMWRLGPAAMTPPRPLAASPPVRRR